MSRSKGGMLSPGYIVLLLAAFNFALCNAGPLPNVTMVDIGLKEGSCALGDVVYMSGDSFPGAGPCERCACAGGQVSCERQRCEPRPGCKAVHRPDHCCPTYQCECEQEGRVYGNGEKLVDPHDPCRVCYCQGGEVVCRRIACFLRDDCRPRLVPGRCCPEYDNCPLRGVTSLPGAASSLGVTSIEDAKGSVAPAQPVEPPKPVITIKEITPVSEIPVTDVKIKEILPSPGIEVEEYTSPKSQLIPREATSEKSTSNMESDAKLDSSDVKPVLSSSAPLTSKLATSSNSEVSNETPSANINVSTQGTTRDEVAPFKILNVVSMMGSPSEPDTRITPLTTKAPVIEEEDLSFLDHNPAFPPIPDDLSVLGNRDDEILPEQNLDVEHVSMDHEIVNVASPIVTEAPIFKEATTLSIVSSVATLTKETSLGSIESSTANHVEDAPPGTAKDNPMLNMRSVIPTEILNSPSLISDEATGDLLDVTDSPAPLSSTSEYFHSTEHLVSTSEENKEVAGLNIPKNISYTEENDPSVNTEDYISSSGSNDAVTPQVEQKFTESLSAVNEGSPDETTNSFSKSTDIISETEFSSIPIETSDQNPHETIDKDNNDTADSTVDSLEITSSKSFPNEAEAVTLSRDVSLEAKDQSLENGETTEFIFAPFGSQETSADGIELVNIASGNDKKSVLENEKTTEFPVSAFGSQESSTDAVELINIASGDGKNSALIDPTSGRKTNVLTDLIKLVGDVASISDHTDAQEIDSQTSKPTTISDSEELIPVNVVSGYKSKNKNRNRNSINADVSIKTKFSKQKVIEIEGEDTYTITDPPPPHDKVEPTTQRAIIDNVSDDNNENKTEITGRKDIEIITQSYVPTINRRPTKVVMKKDNEKASSDESSEEDDIDTVAPVTVRDEAVSFNGENNTSAEAETSTEFQFKESEAVEQSTVGPGAAQ